MTNIPNKTQEERVLQVLKDNQGNWVNGQKFVREMMITQYHRAIWNLENRDGIEIEHSDFKDDYGFISYRINPMIEQIKLF
jgi:hypothetical protein